MKEIILQSEFPCLIINGEEEVFLSPTDILTLRAEEVYVYPVETRQVLAFKLDTSKPSGRNYRTIEHNDKTHCLLFSPKLVTKKAVEKQRLGQIDVTIKICSSELTYQSSHEELVIPLDFPPSEYSCHIVEEFSVLTLKNKNKEKLFIYNPKQPYLKSYNCKKIELGKKEVSFEQTYADFAKSVIKKTLSFDKDKVSEDSSSPKFESYFLNESTLCYAFLDCVMHENFELARNLLGKNLSATDDQFSSFFGRFHSFFPLSFTSFALIYPNETKIISFKTNNMKIIDFEIS